MVNSKGPVVLINWGVDEPIYAQIAGQIRQYIIAGELPAGKVLPPVRSMASDLGVALNTVARAYRILEGERFIAIRDRIGAVVLSQAAEPDGTAIETLTRELVVILARMRQAGLGGTELRRRVAAELERLETDRE